MKESFIHLIAHSHWDREWYMPFEKHRMLLVKLFDDLIELFETDPDFKSFHLDGQTLVIEDYLQVRPERRALVERLVREGKFVVGPWFILQDEFLVSSEANVRNMLLGHADVAALQGKVCKLGYLPDSFGNMGQAPQLFKQAGIKSAVFGRGVKPTGASNMVSETAAFESPYSEMIWRSPDGSEVIGILFANWYHNGMEVPTDVEAAKAYWERKLADAEKYASTPHLLFMNGCDHQPVQKDLSEAIKVARELYPDRTFIHSDFETYIEKVAETIQPEQLATVHGELRSQHTDGWGTLVNTASARVYIKQANQRSQTLLEKVAEPLAAFAAATGTPVQKHFFTYAWKTLLQNHPHDSICGCSVDEVHREMMTRFEKVEQVGSELAKSSTAHVANHIDTSAFEAYGKDAKPFVLFNTSDRVGAGIANVELELEREYFGKRNHEEIPGYLTSLELKKGRVVDEAGNDIAFEIEDLGAVFGYELPEDRFRQPFFARKVRLSLMAEQVPGLGYRTYAWIPSAEPAAAAQVDASAVIATANTLENRFLSVSIEANGTLNVTDKRNGRTYSGLALLEDVGDNGSEYTFAQAAGGAITTADSQAELRLLKSTGEEAQIEITHKVMLPKEAAPELAQEINSMIYFPRRKSGRSAELQEAVIRTTVTLEKDAAAVKLRIAYKNEIKDHRLRMLFPTDAVTDVHHADSIYEVATRNNVPAEEWINPSNCQHQQAFVNVSDERGGLTVANKGLNEYEVLRDGRNTIAVTLLRAVSELGDWGVFATPEAQCLGEHVFECTILPHVDEASKLETYGQAYQQHVPWTSAQLPVQSGSLPAKHTFLDWEGEGLLLSAFKHAETTEGEVIRWYNVSGEARELVIRPEANDNRKYFMSNILEEQGEEIAAGAAGERRITVKPYEIVTIGRV